MKGTDIARLAELSRIHIDAAEMDSIAADLSNILQYVDQISQVADEAPVRDLSHRNIMRADTVEHAPGEYTLDLIKNAPRDTDGYVVVQKIL